MKSFFHFIRNILLLVLIIFGISTYHNDANVRIATNNAIATLTQRIDHFLTSGNLALPKLSDSNPNQTLNNKKIVNSETGTSSDQRTWPHPTANVYLDLGDNALLRSCTIDAMNAWNRTGAFTFKQVENKKKAQIIVSVADDSDTNAAGETQTTYNPVTHHLLRAEVQLNRFYLQNPWYGYSNNRITNTAEHELGHAIGLNHNHGVSVMYPKGSIYTIQPQDIQAVRKLYHEK